MVLTVGDYILTDKICVERKSVPSGDLFESFKSGRLLQQIENMSRYFERPILLIEFDDVVEFRLQEQYQQNSSMLGAGMASSSSGGDISLASIISKLSLLTIHFPKLQILWSRSPKHTAEIFRSLRNLP